MTVLSSPFGDALERRSETPLPILATKDIFFNMPPNFFDYVYSFCRAPALLSIEADRIRHMSMFKMTAKVPMKLTVRNSRTLTITKSLFETIPWPGFFIYNVTRTSITKNTMVDTAPKALVAKLGKNQQILKFSLFI